SSFEFPPELQPQAHETSALLRAFQKRADPALRPSPSLLSAEAKPQVPALGTAMTRSGLYDAPPSDPEVPSSTQLSGDYATTDMVNRLEPVFWRWIESSPAEQEFFGWTLEELRRKSFLDVIHPEDRLSADETFIQALERGEALGLIVKVRTA